MPLRKPRAGSLFILFPLIVESGPEGGQILQRPDREGTQGGGPTSTGLRTPPCTPQRAGSGQKSKHFNGGCSDPPHSTLGGQSTWEPQSSSPSQRKTKPHTWPGLLPAATELQVEGGLGCHLLVLLPAGSMRGQRQRGSAGLSDAGPGPSPTWANTQPREPHNWSRETRCDLHGGGREGLRAPEAAPCRRWHTGIEGHLRGHGEAGAGGSVGQVLTASGRCCPWP